MAADDEAVDPRNVDTSNKSVEELRKILEDKNEELTRLRAEREQAERDQVDAVEKARLVQNIEAVQREIDLEQQSVDAQKATDTQLVATGVSDRPEGPTELVPPDAPPGSAANDEKHAEGDEN